MPQIMLVLAGGLGNQMFQIAAALNVSKGADIAILVHRRYVFLDQECKADIQQLNLPPNIQFVSMGIRAKVSMLIWGPLMRISSSSINRDRVKGNRNLWKYLSLIFKKLHNFDGSIVSELDYLSGNFNPNSKLFLIGYFQNTRALSGLNKEYFSNTPTKKNDYFEKLAEISDEKRIAAIHIRRGDYLKELKFGTLNSDYFAKIIQYLKLNHVIDEFWIFSDGTDSLEKTLHLKTGLNYRVISNKKLTTIETFELMRRASFFVLSNSSYSWWAATCSTNQQVAVYAPTPWFKDLPFHESLYQDNWRKISSEFSEEPNSF